MSHDRTTNFHWPVLHVLQFKPSNSNFKSNKIKCEMKPRYLFGEKKANFIIKLTIVKQNRQFWYRN